MSTRINPKTGVIEESTFAFTSWLPGAEDYAPKMNENGHPERVNQETGVIEEDTGFTGESWTPKK